MRVFLFLCLTACGGSTVDVGEQRATNGNEPTDGGFVPVSARLAPTSDSNNSAYNSEPPPDPAVSALVALAASSPACTLDDIRGPFTFGGVPTVALGLACPPSGAACYRYSSGSSNQVVCRGADGKVQCAYNYLAEPWSGLGAPDEGYDCCIEAPTGSYIADQCFSIDP